MAQWKPIPFFNKVRQNTDETTLRTSSAALENAYITEEGTLSRFPRLNEFLTLPGMGRVYLNEFNGDLIASSGGRTYVIDQENATYRDVTNAILNGAGRTMFSETEDRLLMAAGGKIIQYQNNETKILSADAPESTHVVWLDGYVMIPEKKSNRFNYSENGVYGSFPALNVISAEKTPDDITAMIVTEHNEVMVAGEKSIEQFDSNPSGDVPLYPRWGLGDGLLAPYTLLSADNRLWGINKRKEFVAFSTQIGRAESDDIQKRLEEIDNWNDAWTAEIPINGQRFIVLQIPYAVNRYGNEGLTFLYDYKKRRWSELYGWDEEQGMPNKWAGWSYVNIGDQHFVGGEGKIYLLGGNAAPDQQKMLWRSGFLDLLGSRQSRIDMLRIRIKRGMAGSGESAPIISIRINKDNKGFGRKIRRNLGTMGKRDMLIHFSGAGTAYTWQFEIEITDAAQVEMVRFDALTEDLG